jgi:hypothetical protein
MQTQDQTQEMTFHRAIQVLDQLLFEFTLRSGGGYDCVLIHEAEEALRFLRKKLQEDQQQDQE